MGGLEFVLGVLERFGVKFKMSEYNKQENSDFQIFQTCCICERMTPDASYNPMCSSCEKDFVKIMEQK